MRVGGVSFTTSQRTTIRERTAVKVTPFETFYRENYQSLLGVALAMAKDTASAEDLVQEALISAHHRWDRVSQYDSPHAWVRRVLINRATSLRRRISAEMRAVARVGPPQPAPPDLSPETTEVWRKVRHLPRRQQQAVVLYYVGQLSMVEIADAMGCSAGAVKSHLHRAREALKGSLADWNEESR